jgi:hypothetical protein
LAARCATVRVMRIPLRRILVLSADALLFVYAASWLVIGGLALAGGQIVPLAIAWCATAAVAIGLAATVRLRAGGDAAARALSRLVLLFGVGVISNMGSTWHLMDASGAGTFLVRAVPSAHVFDVLYLWLPQHPHWLKFAAVLHFTAVYPRPLESGSRVRRVLFRPLVLWGVAALATGLWALLDATSPATVRAAALWFSTAMIPVVALLSFLNVLASYREASVTARGRLLGLMAAVLIALGGELFYHAWPIGVAPAVMVIAHNIAPLVASLLAVYAVFVRGGLSPVLVVRRTALYGVLSVAGVFTFALVDELLSSLLVARLGVSEGLVSTVTVAVLAVVFKPVHDRLSAWLNRRLAGWSPAFVEETDQPRAATSQAGLSP